MALISERLQNVIKTVPNWYDDPELIELHHKLFAGAAGVEPDKIVEETWEVVEWFAQALAKNEVMLSTVKPGFNDDDRAGKYEGSSPAPVDTVIVHHTATKDTISEWEIDAFGLLRLYLPFFMNTNPNGFIKFLVQVHPELSERRLRAPASGHYVMRDGKEVQAFAGYHFVIYPGGRTVQLLDKDHMAFHAGNLEVNNRSYGVVFAGAFVDGEPTQEAQTAFKKLMEDLNTSDVKIAYLDTHKHVRMLGPTDCPGDWFEEFRKSEEFADLTEYPMPT
jgi:hypothetical protein